MKIAVNTRLLIENNMEGVGWFATEILRRMTNQHPEDTFYFFFDRPFDKKFIFNDNIVPLVLSPQTRHPVLWYLWFEWSVPRALKRVGADVFLTPDAYCSLRTDVPTTSVVHDLAFEHFPEQVPALVRQYYRYFWPRFVKKARRIVTVSEYTRQDLHRIYQVPMDKMDVACNGARPEFHPLTQTEKARIRQKYSNGNPFFVYVGAIHPRKNIARLIHAFDRFKSSTGAPHQLLLVGRMAWMRSDVDTAIKNIDHKDSVQFLGYTGEDLPDIMASADALVYVSLFEGFGIPVLEAMHCEVPVITSMVSSMPEVAGDAALLVDPGNTEEIAGAMTKLYKKPSLGKELVAKGRSQRQKFTWEKAANVVYRNLIKSIEGAYPPG